MSLKAKLEAVIYAAEEPVTLAQFAMLFAHEAFAWKAEREARNLELALTVDSPVDAAQGDSAPELTPEPVAGIDTQAEAEASAPDAEKASEAAADAELEARRLARARERETREILRGVLDELIADYAGDGRGIEIREIAGGYRMATKPEMHDAVRAFVKSQKPPMKLSLPALETLAVIAYKQPVTAPEVGEIRGVDSAGVLGSLISRKLIATAGRKQVVGRPMLYKTTKEFLLRLGLKDLNELPSMEEFEKMAALELNETSLDEESNEPAEPVEQPGDLFVTDGAPGAKLEDEPEAAAGASKQAVPEVVPELSTPTAEPSEEAAEAHAIVERQQEIEVEP
jgi:segregation and condensation protein B